MRALANPINPDRRLGFWDEPGECLYDSFDFPPAGFWAEGRSAGLGEVDRGQWAVGVLRKCAEKNRDREHGIWDVGCVIWTEGKRENYVGIWDTARDIGQGIRDCACGIGDLGCRNRCRLYAMWDIGCVIREYGTEKSRCGICDVGYEIVNDRLYVGQLLTSEAQKIYKYVCVCGFVAYSSGSKFDDHHIMYIVVTKWKNNIIYFLGIFFLVDILASPWRNSFVTCGCGIYELGDMSTFSRSVGATNCELSEIPPCHPETGMGNARKKNWKKNFHARMMENILFGSRSQEFHSCFYCIQIHPRFVVLILSVY